MSSIGVRHELFQRFCSKASCLSFRCSALVCGANRRITFRLPKPRQGGFQLEHQFHFDIIMLIDRIQERITLKVMIHTLSTFWRQSGLLVTVSQCL